MQLGGSKLSKHVLGMKFMRKTKEQLDQGTTEKNHRKHFGVKGSTSEKNTKSTDYPSNISGSSKSSSSFKSDKLSRVSSSKSSVVASLASNKLTTIIEETPSYSQCLDFTFGRFSFGGFNPTVEYNMKRGAWKAGFCSTSQDLLDDDDDNEKDVDDIEMTEALRGGSLVGSLGKHFMSKKQRNEQNSKDNVILDETPDRKIKGKQGSWKKNNQSQGSWFNANGQQALRQHSYKDSPPAKKRRFMKPSDD